ncbi:MAG: hypothetical protein ACYS99_16795 [Planctomycetota bacterium]
MLLRVLTNSSASVTGAPSNWNVIFSSASRFLSFASHSSGQPLRDRDELQAAPDRDVLRLQGDEEFVLFADPEDLRVHGDGDAAELGEEVEGVPDRGLLEVQVDLRRLERLPDLLLARVRLDAPDPVRERNEPCVRLAGEGSERLHHRDVRELHGHSPRGDLIGDRGLHAGLGDDRRDGRAELDVLEGEGDLPLLGPPGGGGAEKGGGDRNGPHGVLPFSHLRWTAPPTSSWSRP